MNFKKIIISCLIVFIIGAIISALLPLIKWAIIICLALILTSIVYNAIINIKHQKEIQDNIINAQVINERENKE